MRKFALLTAAAATVALLAACDDKEECTPEVAQQKATELMTKIQELATSNPEKLAALGPKATEFAAKAQAAQDDPEAVCEAVDELMAEIEK